MRKPIEKYSGREKRNLKIVAAVIVTFLVMGAWNWYANLAPQIDSYLTPLPPVNGYDFFVKSVSVEIPGRVDPIHDSNIIPKAQWKTAYPTSAKEAWLATNATSLKLLRQGLKLPCRMPTDGRNKLDSTPPGIYSQFREMARTLCVEAHAYAERGRWGKSAESNLDGMQFGSAVQNGLASSDYLVGNGIVSIAWRDVQDTVPHLSAVEAAGLTHRLENLIASRTPPSAAFREEKSYRQLQLVQICRGNDWSWLHDDNDYNDEFPDYEHGWLGWKARTEFSNRSKRRIFRNMNNYLDELARQSTNVYTKIKVPPLPDDLYCQVTLRWLPRLLDNDRRTQTMLSLLLTRLALQAHFKQHGHYPARLSDLVPRYLRQIPLDPYGGGETIHYTVNSKAGKKYVLYSRGPDGDDDGGTAGINKTNPRHPYLVFTETKGDFVAGINY